MVDFHHQYFVTSATMNPRFGSRKWVKLWVNEWLDGTTRLEMMDAQRAFWVDLLAMAGRSRFPGIVCAGEIAGKIAGYPLSKYQSLMSDPIDIEQTLALFESTQKIHIIITAEVPQKLVAVEILNWAKFQSEYQRQKPYRQQLQRKLQESDRPSDNQSNTTEVEVRSRSIEEEQPIRAKAAQVLAQFEEFWKRYPRKSDRKRAFTAWRNLSQADRDLAMKNLDGWLQCRQWREEGGRYVPYAQKWLNRELFKDDPRATAAPDDFDERFTKATKKA